MKSNALFRSTILFAAIVLAVPVFAKPVNKIMNLAQASKIGKADLASGEYRFLIDENKVTVMKGKKMIVETQGRWEERSNKSDYDSVLVAEDGQVKEMRFAGQKRVFVLSE
ncbi:MAG: hypothetical protein PVS2B2_02660 [Candidatus Acidiferrum sp.]